MWVSRWLERHVLRLDALAPNMRIASPSSCRHSSWPVRAGGPERRGLDLTTLNVLTGAIGIGLGFGLQSIAANFVSDSCC